MTEKQIAKKVKELLRSMTIEEKVAQMTQVPYTQVSKEKAEYYASIGVGSFLHVLGDEARRLQKIACSSAKKIPLLFGIDAIHGHALNKHATIFPTQLSMACSFRPDLVERMAEITAEEVAADGLHWTFSPVLCLGRDIRWGRVAETFGEDKYLSSVLGAAMVRGYQGEGLSKQGKILACAKHYIGYGESTGGRDSYDTSITYRKVKNDFLLPFEEAVKAGCATVMTAYGSIDGTPCTADKKLLRDILKNELNFDGFIVTDWDNVGHLVYDHHVASDINEATVLAMESGNDMMMSTLDFYETAVKLVKDGVMPIQTVDDAVKRILTVKMRLGLFENPEKGKADTVMGGGQELNKELARESIVLLKNDGILPLQDKKMRIAVIGDAAKNVRDMLGEWTYFTHPEHHFDETPVPPYSTLFDGLKEIAKETEIVYAKGVQALSNSDNGIVEAVEIAKQSDIVVFAFGDTIHQTGEGRDRAFPELTTMQKKLFEALLETEKPIVSVMIASKPLCIPEVAEKSNALLTGFNVGAFGGLALAEVIFGKVNPSGKLCISIPYHVGQQPVYYNTLPGWHCSRYVDMPNKPLFAFGKGLSYTKFEYDNLLFDEKTFTLSVIVKNIGQRAGKETVQVYLRDCVSSVITPIRQLVAFEKIELDKGEEKRVYFTLSLKDFSFVNRCEQRVVEKGKFEIMVGGSSDYNDLLKTMIELKEEVIC